MDQDKGVLLCVDDEVIVLAVLKEILLCEFGNKYIIETAESASEGLEVISDLLKDGYKIMLILSDWLMPGMKGDEFLIKAHELTSNTVNILLSGQVEESVVRHIDTEAGLHYCLPKPWDRKELLEAISSGLEVFNSRQA